MAKKVGKKPVGKASASKVQLKPRTSSKPVLAKSAAKPAAKKPVTVAKPVSEKPSTAKPAIKPVVAKPLAKTPKKTPSAKPIGGKPAVAPTPAVVAAKPKSAKLAAPSLAVGPAVRVLPDGTIKRLKKKKSSRLAISKPELPPVRLPPPPVTSDSKMAKNRAGFAAKELEHFRDLLLEKRRELLGDVTSMEREALRSGNTNLSNLPLHMADTGTDNYEQEFTLGLVEKDRQLLREIQVALAKIQDGSYGVCEGTGKPISKARLEVQPWARHSIEYARQMEKPIYRRAY